MVWEFVIAEGQYEGWRLWKYNGLDSADKIGWLKNDLHKAGLKLEKLTDLGESLEHLLDRALEVNVKTKGEYQNVYINKEISLEPSTNMAPIDINDEDLPF